MSALGGQYYAVPLPLPKNTAALTRASDARPMVERTIELHRELSDGERK